MIIKTKTDSTADWCLFSSGGMPDYTRVHTNSLRLNYCCFCLHSIHQCAAITRHDWLMETTTTKTKCIYGNSTNVNASLEKHLKGNTSVIMLWLSQMLQQIQLVEKVLFLLTVNSYFYTQVGVGAMDRLIYHRQCHFVSQYCHISWC